jgi:capsular polysaccharide biosynthesis protein
MRALLWRLAVRFERQLRAVRALVRVLLGAVSRAQRSLPGTSLRFGPPRRFTYDTWTWATRGGAQDVREVDARWTTDRTPVRAGAQQVPHQFVDSLRWPMPRTYVITLDEARVWGPDAAVITRSDTVLADLTNALGVPPEQQPVLRRPYLGRPERLPGVTATIGARYASSYHHWMFDLLPRLDVLVRSGVPFDRLLAPDALGFQRETLDAAGFPAPRRISATPDTYLLAERLVVPSMPGTPGQAPPAACAYLRRLFASALGERRQFRRLYVSRNDTSRRHLTNEAELVAALEPLGFESVTMSGRSVAEQAALFAEAEVVVAPHGGALTNIVFCQPGTKVVELFPAGYTPVCFWTITDAIGLDYRPLFDQSVAPHDGSAQWLPYTVDPARVLAAL